MTATEVKDLLEAQRRLIAQLQRATTLLDGVFAFINEMTEEEVRAIVDTAFVDELLKGSEHLGNASEELLRGVRDA